MAIAKVEEKLCDASPGCPASRSCPANAFVRNPGGTYRVEKRACLGCGRCVFFCKGKAITME